MKMLETRATSRSTALCNPITLREGEQVRLVFVPAIVDNPANPKASVDGHFVYQRKTRSDTWIPVPTVALSSLKSGEGFKLSLHAQELYTFFENIVQLYQFYRTEGVPKGFKTYVELDRNVADFVSRGEKDLAGLLEAYSEDAATVLLQLVRWLATSPGRREAAARLAAMAPEQMPSLTALLALAALKDALAYWKQNHLNDSEEFWQQSLAERAYVLSQLFAYPVVLIGSKAYVGGKQINKKGGKEVDFLFAIESTNSLILLEIKTPQTKLLGAEYREGVFPLSRDLAAAVAQVLRYRQSLMRRFDSISAETPGRMTLGEPRCVVIAGNSKELTDHAKRENFELQRERVRGVTIITFDELFERLLRLVTLLEGTV
jgi:Shedu protein SduA, N-terminal/Shedu protein SduA, C-terminal